jgi:glycosyltransferase involved in cell wall biosynthesis
VAGIYGFTDTMRSPLQVLYRRQLRCADAVVCNAPHLAQEAIDRHHAPSSRTSVIANGVDTSARSTPVDTQPPTAVVVANFHAYKGHADLLHALALVPETVEVFVRLCGTGRGRDEMRELAKTLGVDARVVFVEPPADISAELRHAQFAIHPSHTEGMSNAILEELGAGLPVIACNVGGNPGLISSEVNGLLVPASDPVALAAAVTRMVLDPVLRGQMSQMARASAEQHSWPACTQAHIELYSEVCARAER